MRTTIAAKVLLASLAAGCASDAPMAQPAKAPPAAKPAVAAAARTQKGALPPTVAPAERDGLGHRWELRAFDDNRIEVWCDGERVPDEHIVRDGHRVAVVDAAGVVVERLDMPPAWNPDHGKKPADGTYRTIDGKVLVPPTAMLGGRLEQVPPATLAHVHAEHTAADGSRCAYVARVIPGLPMDAAGVKAHDVIVAVNGSPDASPDAVRAVVRAAKPGDTVSLRLVRAGATVDATVTLAAWDPKHMVEPFGQRKPAPPASASPEPSAATQVASASAAAAAAASAAATAAAANSAPAPDAAAQPAATASAEELAAARKNIEDLKAQLAALQAQTQASGASGAELAAARKRVEELEAEANAAKAAAAAAAAAATATPAPAPAAPVSDDLEAARRRIAELEAQVRKEDAVHRAIRPKAAPQPTAGGSTPK
jgi:sulfur carrier protein ThiS